MKFLHKGAVTWECERCSAHGMQDFEFEDERPVPSQDGYIHVLANAETTHSLAGCSGSVRFVVAQRTTVQMPAEEKAS